MLSNIINGLVTTSKVVSKLVILVFENVNGDILVIATDVFDKCITTASRIIK